MALVQIFGGCDAEYNDFITTNSNETYSECNYYSHIEPECEARALITPTIAPTTAMPTKEPTNVPTFEYSENVCCHAESNDISQYSEELTCNLLFRRNLCLRNGCIWNSDGNACDEGSGSCTNTNGRRSRVCAVYGSCVAACNADQDCQWLC